MSRAQLVLLSVLSILMPSLPRVATAQPPGNMDRMLSVGFLNASTGLVSYADPPSNTYIFTKDGVTLVPGMNGARWLTVQDADVAWATVGNGLYRGDRGWSRWTLIDTTLPHHIVGCANGQLFFMSDSDLYSATADGITRDIGILPLDGLEQIDYQSSRTIYGLGGFGLYRSTDGGHEWSLYYRTTARGLFVDRVHHRIYLGGPVRVSTDDGVTWNGIPSESDYPFLPLYGTLSGAHDCTGAFYVAPAGNATDAYRFGEDGFFHNVGPVLLSPYPRPGQSMIPGQLQVFDGGAIAYSIADHFATFNGIDGALTDSARGQIIASIAPRTVDLCGAGHDSLRITISSRTCLPISIDSVRAITSIGSVTSVKSASVIAGASVTIAAKYTARARGSDTVTVRVFLHSVEGRGYRESTDATGIVTITGSAPVLSVTSSLDFGAVQVDSTSRRTIVLRNTGCLALTLDSVVSSHANLFTVQSRTFPISLAHGDSVAFSVTYHPVTSGEDLESLEIGTNAGHRFVTLTGRATGKLDVSGEDGDANALVIHPTPGALLVSSSESGSLTLYGLTGQFIASWALIAGSTVERCDLAGATLPPGLYFVRLRVNGSQQVRTQRILVP